jgi:transcription antitermination factor NusG
LASAATVSSERVISVEATRAPWHVIWTHSHFEDLVGEQLVAKGFHPFVPKVDAWTRRGGARQIKRVPLFASYLFLNDALDKPRHVEVRKTRGLVDVLGESWDRPATVPDAEIEAIRRITDSGLTAMPHPYLREGRRVRIAAGPLADVEGILVKVRPDKGLVVVSVNLLQRSVAVEVDCTRVVPA